MVASLSLRWIKERLYVVLRGKLYWVIVIVGCWLDQMSMKVSSSLND